jgi:hypothetical protein
MKPHSVLIVTEKPDQQEGERYKQWLAFLNDIAGTIKKVIIYLAHRLTPDAEVGHDSDS